MVGSMIDSLDTNLKEVLLWSLGKTPECDHKLSQIQVAKFHYDALLIHFYHLI